MDLGIVFTLNSDAYFGVDSKSRLFHWEDGNPWTDHVNMADEFGIAGQRLVSCAASATDEGSEVAFVFPNGLTVRIQDRDERASYSIVDHTPEGKRN